MFDPGPGIPVDVDDKNPSAKPKTPFSDPNKVSSREYIDNINSRDFARAKQVIDDLNRKTGVFEADVDEYKMGFMLPDTYNPSSKTLQQIGRFFGASLPFGIGK